MSAYPRKMRFTDGTETHIRTQAEHTALMVRCTAEDACEYAMMMFSDIGQVYGCWKCFSAPVWEAAGAGRN